MRSFLCRDSFDYGWAQNAGYFHIRILGDHSCHVGATWLQQTVSLGSVYFKESICRPASLRSYYSVSFSSTIIILIKSTIVLSSTLIILIKSTIVRFFDIIDPTKKEAPHRHTLEVLSIFFSKVVYLERGRSNIIKWSCKNQR